jgi:hypothetical protein
MPAQKPLISTIRFGRQSPGDTEIADSFISEHWAKSTAITALGKHFVSSSGVKPPHTAWVFNDAGVQVAKYQVGLDGKVISA